MENFRYAFLGVRTLAVERLNTARATPLARFAYAHDKFFHAVDLPAALDYAKPWDRVELSALRSKTRRLKDRPQR